MAAYLMAAAFAGATFKSANLEVAPIMRSQGPIEIQADDRWNAGFLTPVGCHTWRATGVTVYLENGGRLEHAQQMAAHESPRTTKLYDRTKDEITIGEVERIQL